MHIIYVHPYTCAYTWAHTQFYGVLENTTAYELQASNWPAIHSVLLPEVAAILACSFHSHALCTEYKKEEIYVFLSNFSQVVTM